MYLKLVWTQLEIAHLQGPCSLRPCSTRTQCMQYIFFDFVVCYEKKYKVNFREVQVCKWSDKTILLGNTYEKLKKFLVGFFLFVMKTTDKINIVEVPIKVIIHWSRDEQFLWNRNWDLDWICGQVALLKNKLGQLWATFESSFFMFSWANVFWNWSWNIFFLKKWLNES